MRIAILGTRGIPANYGGFETFAEELSVRLSARGHEVTVYCRRSSYNDRLVQYRGVHLVNLPSIHTKYLDTLSHTFVSTLHLLLRGADIAYYCNSVNSWFTAFPRLRGTRVLLNVDGLEWERAKWSWAGKAFHKMSAFATTLFPNVLITDSRVLQSEYKNLVGAESEYVTYGAEILERGFGKEIVKDLGVEPEKYILFVSRLEPENNAHLLAQAFRQVKTDMKCLIVGTAPFASDYIRELHKSAKDERILFPGGIYGDGYRALCSNAHVYVNAMEVGGTHPAILENMAAGNCVCVSDISYNAEVVGDAGILFRNRDVEDLRAKLQGLVDRPDEVEQWRAKAVDRIRAKYTWDSIVDQYERLFTKLLNG